MIEIQSLHKSFGAKPALRDVTLAVAPGERLALVGHNGSGKTTLVRCLLGLHNYEGTVRVNGLEVRANRTAVLRDVGFVPQQPPALRQTVAEYLALAQAICGVDPVAVTAVAKALGLDVAECRRRPFRKLSGGMRQKLLVAVALARRPSLLVLDEPTANLDPAARGAFFEQLAALPPETAMLLTSHRVDELAGLVTRLVELDAGGLARDEPVAVGRSGASLGDKVRCRIIVTPDAPSSVTWGLAAWGLLKVESPAARGEWQGLIGAPDRFRFLADLTRWSGALATVEMSDECPPLRRILP